MFQYKYGKILTNCLIIYFIKFLICFDFHVFQKPQSNITVKTSQSSSRLTKKSNSKSLSAKTNSLSTGSTKPNSTAAKTLSKPSKAPVQPRPQVRKISKPLSLKLSKNKRTDK